MDFFRDWPAGVKTLDGFETVQYYCYVPRLGEVAGGLSMTPYQTADLIDAAQEQLIQAGGFAHVDYQDAKLWTFLSPSQADLGVTDLLASSVKAALSCQDLSDIVWSLESSGTVGATKLLASMDSSDQAASAAAGTSAKPSAKASQEDELHFHCELYRCFMAATMSLISYTLAKHARAIPLNFRTCAHLRPNGGDDALGKDDLSLEAMICLSQFKIQLTPSGALIITWNTKRQPGMRSLRNCSEVIIGKPLDLIRIAPSGRIARLDHRPEIRAHPTRETVDPERKAWRQLVVRWLARRGIRVYNINDDTQWVRILLSASKCRPKPSGASFEWPAELCFSYGHKTRFSPDISMLAYNPGTQGLHWFEEEPTSLLYDPVAFATDWALNATSRDEELELRRRKRAEASSDSTKAISALQKPEPATLSAARFAPFGESINAAGVYPTPPDGQPLPSSSSGPGNDAHFSKLQPPTDSVRDEPFNDADDVAHDSSPRPTPLIPARASFDVGMTQQEYFPDQDDGLFEHGDMTEADFDFFDDPGDAMDKTMLDVDNVLDDLDITQQDAINLALLDDVGPADILPVPKAEEVSKSRPDENSYNSPRRHSPNDKEVQLQGESALAPRIVDFVIRSSNRSTRHASPVQQELTFLEQQNFRKPHDIVNFDMLLRVADTKYASTGRFGQLFLANTNSPSEIRAMPGIPRLNSLQGGEFQPDTLRIDNDVDTAQSDEPLSLSSDDDSSDDDISVSSTVYVPPAAGAKYLNFGYKRRRLLQDRNAIPGIMDSTGAINDEARDPSSSPIDNVWIGEILGPRAIDWSLVDFPAPRNGSPSLSTMTGVRATPSGSDLINIAQLVVNQLAFATRIRLLSRDLRIAERDGLLPTTSNCPQDFDVTFGSVLTLSETKDFQSFVMLGKTMGAETQATTGSSQSVPRADNSIYKIKSRHVRVTRGQGAWELLPAAISFWNTLGLGPCAGPKDVSAYCIFPFNNAMRRRAGQFLDTICSAYENLRLGRHIKGVTVKDMTDGLVPVRAYTPITVESAVEAIQEVCSFLGRNLVAAKNEYKTVIIYLVDPFQTSTSMFQLCTCFWNLLQAYRADLPSKVQPCKLVLQVVPIDLIASFQDSIVFNPDTAASLAYEVYDRCPPNPDGAGARSLPIRSGAAIQLERGIPRGIQFELTPDPPMDLLKENTSLHIAYYQSVDDKWITTAWVDKSGEYQTSLSYSTIGRDFGEIAREIWAATLAITKVWRITWRIFIVRVGCMIPEEQAAWKEIVAMTQHQSFSMTLLSVDPDPTLSVTPKQPAVDVSSPRPVSQLPHNALGTPVATPQGPGTPDQHMALPATPSSATPAASGVAGPGSSGAAAAATPDASSAANAGDLDATSILIDITAETWGVLLSHRLDTSPVLTERVPALLSGYLAKRAGMSDADGVVFLEVNLLWMSGTGSSTSGGSGAILSPGTADTSAFTFPTTSTSTTNAAAPANGTAGQLPGAQQANEARLYETRLREALAMYAGLAQLARLRGVEGPQSLRPWHVAVAVKGAEGLSGCMPYLS